ncbi:uncharacterized protein [Phyllobates terribilis]|uniref:uncharacterized protein n=1 Tax=Phyllobates terribilis TaxID=111132 RepID=UPI003CCB38F5
MDLIKKCVVLLLLHQTGAALEVSAPTTYVATMGSDNLIPCEYTVEKPPVDPKFFAAFWFFQGKEILTYDNEVRTTDSRYSLDTEKALQGLVDLSISDFSMSDAGVYTCSVIYSPDRKKKDITVDVKALPQVTITSKTVNEKSVLRCFVTRFYPADIDIKWFRGSERLSDVTEDPPLRNPDRTYSVNSTVTITPTEEDRERIFSCRVQHESLKQPLQEDFQLGYKDKSATSGNENLIILIAAVVVILLITTVISLTVIYLKIRKQSEYLHCRHIAEAGVPAELKIGDVITPDLTLNRNANLKCPLYIYKVGEHYVEWYEKKQDTEKLIPNSDNRRLQTVDKNDGNSWTAYLALTPVNIEDDEIKYICKVKGSQQTVEASASTEELSVTAPPQVTVTDKMAVVNAESVLRCSVTGFYPADIDIKWFRGSERLSDVTEGPPLRNQDGLYSVNSSVTITPTEEDREQNFSCRVQHTSLEEPLQKDFQLIFTEQKSLLNNKNGKSSKSPGKSTSQNIPGHPIVASYRKETETSAKERNPLGLKKQDEEGFRSVNESSQTKIPPKSAEQETEQLRKSHGHKNTERPKNGKRQELCPGNELPGEEEMEEHSLSTNKTGHEKKRKSCTNKEDKEANQEKENEGTSHLITDSFPQQESNASMGRSTGEDKEEMINTGASLNKEGADTEEISKEYNNEGRPPEDSDNEETSQLIHTGALANKEAELKEISMEGGPENSGGRPLGDSDNEGTSLLSK